jgi:hypothetical protein
MTRASTRLLFALMLTSGCAAHSTSYGAGAAAGLPPPLPAGAVAPRWDHYCAVFSGGLGGEAAFTSLIDQASSASWEMVSIAVQGAAVLICFKRPRADAAPVAPDAPSA